MKHKLVKKWGGEYFKTVSTMLTGAFGLVAALAWNELIKELITRYLSAGSGVISKLIYALIITTLLVILTVQLGKMSEKFKEEDESWF